MKSMAPSIATTTPTFQRNASRSRQENPAVRAIAAPIAAFALVASAQAADNKLSPQQFDLACAVVAGANMGNAVNKGGDGYLIALLAFYLGRLSARDDT
jgi:hypothetical protein